MQIDQFKLKSPDILANKAHIDMPLLLAFFVIFLISGVAIYSASNGSIDFLIDHATKIIISILAMIIAAQLSPLDYKRIAPWLYFLCVILLILVLVIGETRNNATRWLNLGIIFQPSELMKIAMPLMIARFISNGTLPVKNLSIITSLFIVLFPTTMILLQPDLGTSILIAFSGLVIIFLSGIKKRHMLSGLLIFIASLPLIWRNIHPFQQKRVLTFLDPENDPLGAGYHIIQSKIAIGSGGLFGKGWMNGTQGQLNFLPETTTDFIFSILAEEFGLIGISGVIAIYLFIVARGLLIAINSQDLFSRLLASSISLTFFIYVFVNMGMTTGILPVVGVPLPLISKGGTSSVTLMIGLGILMSIRTHKRLVPK